MADYCTAAQIKDAGTLNVEGAQYDTSLARAVTAASRWIDQHCWGIDDAFKATAQATRYYGSDDVHGQSLHVQKPLLSVATLTNGDGNTIASGNYWLTPRNSTPYFQVQLKSTALWTFTTDGWIEVTGVWGYSTAVPSPVQEAAIILAGWLFKTYQNALQNAGQVVPELGQLQYSANFPKQVYGLLLPYQEGTGL
ncbi:hypothetical protein GC175_17060 [bacterium]|nr:hypothetical protein [bacterium]